MTSPITITLDGIPVAKGRPRFVRATGRAYTPSKTRAFETDLGYTAKEVMAGRPLLDGPLMVLVVACFLALISYDPLTGLFHPKIGRPGWRLDQPMGHVESTGYRRIMIEGRRYYAHRLAWFYVYGVWPILNIDHIDMAQDNNQIANLRQATNSQNQANITKSRANTSGLKGAVYNRFRGYWQSYIKVLGKNVFLGRFETKKEAHAAYCAGAAKYFGEFARTE